MSKMDEVILAAPRVEIFGMTDARSFQGVSVDAGTVERVIRSLGAHGSARRRGDVEDDPSYLQPIPYVVVLRPAEDGEREVFVYERLVEGGEARLHGRLSVGVGGHMNASCGTIDSATLFAEAEREILEELYVDRASGPLSVDLEIAGIINVDATPVDRVHVGILMLLTLPSYADARVRESDQLRGGWMRLCEALSPEVMERMEEWSRLALRALDDVDV